MAYEYAMIKAEPVQLTVVFMDYAARGWRLVQYGTDHILIFEREVN